LVWRYRRAIITFSFLPDKTYDAIRFADRFPKHYAATGGSPWPETVGGNDAHRSFRDGELPIENPEQS
jgi:hypothetical protein